MQHTVYQWIRDARENGITSIVVADRELAEALGLKHCRSGLIERGATKEGAGTPVRAYGFDELGNVCAICADGVTRQFYR